MITETQIIEAAKACDYSEFSSEFRTTTEKLIALAQHFYKQGLLDAAEKCDRMWKKEDSFDAHTLREAIRNMAEEVRK